MTIEEIDQFPGPALQLFRIHILFFSPCSVLTLETFKYQQVRYNYEEYNRSSLYHDTPFGRVC